MSLCGCVVQLILWLTAELNKVTQPFCGLLKSLVSGRLCLGRVMREYRVSATF